MRKDIIMMENQAQYQRLKAFNLGDMKEIEENFE